MDFKTIIGIITSPLVVALIVVPLTAYINIKIKFSQTEKDAKDHFVSLGKKIFRIALNLYILFLLVMEVFSPEPLTRMSVFLMILYTSSLLLFFMVATFVKIYATIDRHVDLTAKLADKIAKKFTESSESKQS